MAMTARGNSYRGIVLDIEGRKVNLLTYLLTYQLL